MQTKLTAAGLRALSVALDHLDETNSTTDGVFVQNATVEIDGEEFYIQRDTRSGELTVEVEQ